MPHKWTQIRRKHSPAVEARIRKEVEDAGKVIARRQSDEEEGETMAHKWSDIRRTLSPEAEERIRRNVEDKGATLPELEQGAPKKWQDVRGTFTPQQEENIKAKMAEIEDEMARYQHEADAERAERHEDSAAPGE